jgi:hypothetical protein
MYLVVFAQGICRRLELVGVLDCAQVVGAERLVGLAGVGEVGRPWRAVERLEDEEDLSW